MASQAGNSMIMEIGADPTALPSADTYTTIAGFKSHNFGRTRGRTDTTNKSSAGHTSSLAGTGVRTSTLSGSGTFDDTTAFATYNTAFDADSYSNFRVTVPGLGVWVGKFHIDSLSWNSDADGDVMFDTSLTASGALSFTASP